MLRNRAAEAFAEKHGDAYGAGMEPVENAGAGIFCGQCGRELTFRFYRPQGWFANCPRWLSLIASFLGEHHDTVALIKAEWPSDESRYDRLTGRATDA